MPRKPNYRFDRQEKDRAKAAKKAERLKAKQDRSNNRQVSNADGDGPELVEAETGPGADDAEATTAETS